MTLEQMVELTAGYEKRQGQFCYYVGQDKGKPWVKAWTWDGIGGPRVQSAKMVLAENSGPCLFFSLQMAKLHLITRLEGDNA